METTILVGQDTVSHPSKDSVAHTDDTSNTQSSSSLESPVSKEEKDKRLDSEESGQNTVSHHSKETVAHTDDTSNTQSSSSLKSSKLKKEKDEQSDQDKSGQKSVSCHSEETVTHTDVEPNAQSSSSLGSPKSQEEQDKQSGPEESGHKSVSHHSEETVAHLDDLTVKTDQELDHVDHKKSGQEKETKNMNVQISQEQEDKKSESEGTRDQALETQQETNTKTKAKSDQKDEEVKIMHATMHQNVDIQQISDGYLEKAEKVEEGNVDEKNVEDMEHQTEQEMSEDTKWEETEEMEQEPSEKNEQKEQGCSDGTVKLEEKVNDDSSPERPIDGDDTEERMQVVSPETQEAQDLKNENNEPVLPPGQSFKSVIVHEKTETPPASSSPTVKVKDEPMDEEYEKALGPQSTTGHVKDEPDMADEFGQKTSEMIKISAVFSVGKPAPSVGKSSGTGSPAGTNPPSSTSASSLCVACSGCKKVLLKGQTAFQRKGCSQLFCSPRCLCTSTSTEQAQKKSCYYCHKEISNPKDVIMAPVDSAGTVRNFCSQKCLSGFKYKRDGVNPALISEHSAGKCSMCQKVGATKHEVNVTGSVHKLCSNSCFHQFCSTNKLNMNCCCHCGGYCHNVDGKSAALIIDGTVKKFCSQICLIAYKSKYAKPLPCTMCRGYRTLLEMVESPNAEGNKELFCSSSCVTEHKVQIISASGDALECHQCNQITVPQYHLAMSDGNIHNFCSFTCAVAFQDGFSKTNSGATPLNMIQAKPTSTLQSGSPESSSTVTSSVPSMTRIPCSQCLRLFFSKPELLEFKGKMYFFCDKSCIDEFRRTNYIMAQCVYCKIDKVVKEIKRINNVDCSFCSEGCKLLYKHDLAKHWGKKYCRNCLYCDTASPTVVTSVFSGKQEEFCSNECLSQYTLLFCEVAKCSVCKRARKLNESVKWLGEIKHFCNLHCLTYFCSLNGCAATPSKPSTKAQGTVPSVGKPIGTASTQTDGARQINVSNRGLKNKALLCKPMTQNRGTACKPNTSDMNTQTDEVTPKMMLFPLPVPVFVPLPMHLYTQYTPHSFGFPLPLPVPMFLPVTVDNVERLMETIQEIKEKIPENPLEADLIMMAEMVAEDSEKEKAVSHGDQEENFIEDFDLEALSSHFSWDEESVSSASRLGRGSESEKVAPSRRRSPSPPSQEPQMDLEADFPVESFDQPVQKSTTPAATKSKSRKKSRESFSQRKKGHKHAESPSRKAASQNSSKLYNDYGVQAWKSWIHWRNTQTNIETPKFGSRNIMLKEDLLQCSTAELSYGLCKFVNEVKRPNGDPYSPDSIFYLCLGIQQYLFQNGRMENIFADFFYSNFSHTISSLLKGWKPTILPSGYMHSRVEEEYLWECKQLGAFSPSVLLNTLLYFCTKFFSFKTVAQHRRLSFAHIMRCSRTNSSGDKRSCLRFYPPVPKDTKSAPKSSKESVPAKRKREEDEDEEEGAVLEMKENLDNPLRCPVRLYEFYISKCSASVKQRTNIFFLRPERSCVPNSPLWFSSESLDDDELENMLTRILTVRDIHLDREPPRSLSESDDDNDSD
ncbi:zinc finger MYM-type protein 4 [Trichomycterus rosablanca]|uniref:zinc finger MYM-type protein 4 n=1 Tax=Trichomycterus rosablanca TaxID=2290929 RepID=UPI002F352B6D